MYTSAQKWDNTFVECEITTLHCGNITQGLRMENCSLRITMSCLPVLKNGRYYNRPQTLAVTSFCLLQSPCTALQLNAGELFHRVFSNRFRSAERLLLVRFRGCMLFFNSETKLLISLTWQNRSSFGFVCDPKPCLHMFTSFPFLCLWSCWRSSQTRYISPHGFGCHICGFTSLLHLQDRVWGMRDDLWSGNPPPLPIPPHPSHSSLTHVQAHPVRCSWSVSSSLLQQSVNKLSLSSPLHIPTPSFCFCRSYQFNLSSRNSSFSLGCWFVWHAVSRPGECCSNTL